MFAFLALLACSDPGTVAVLSGHAFEWQLFNHRLSHLSFRMDDSGAVRAAAVGGTSTTGQAANLADYCEPETCQEFPFIDTADLRAGVTTFTAPGLISSRGSATWVVGAEENSAPVELVWESDPGEFVVLISGFSLDAGSTTGGCYNPQFGWLPRKLALSAAIDGPHATVTGVFEAGLSFEDERACLDEAAEFATVALTVDVVAIAGIQTRSTTVEQAGQYELGSTSDPDSQPAPEAESIGGALGWSAWEWNFHEADLAGRGAYLRSFGLNADGHAGAAAASNYSPATQLSDFDYRFVGTVISPSGGDENLDFQRVELAGEYAPTLDEVGAAILVELK